MFTFRYPTEKYSQPANFGVRLLAFIVDSIFIAILLFVLSLITQFFDFEFSDTQRNLVFTIYIVFFTWKYGRTFGKYHTELKVVKTNGDKISLLQSILRSIFYWALVIIPLIFAYIGISEINVDDKSGDITFDSGSLLLSLFKIFGSYLLIILLILIDGLFILIRNDKRALHDLIAGTKCMKK